MSASPTAISEQILSEKLNSMITNWETIAKAGNSKNVNKAIQSDIIAEFPPKGKQGVFSELLGVLSNPDVLENQSIRLTPFVDFMVSYATKEDPKPVELANYRNKLKTLFDKTDFPALGYDEKNIPEWKGSDAEQKAKSEKVKTTTRSEQFLESTRVRAELNAVKKERDDLKKQIDITSLIGTAAGRWGTTEDLLKDLKPLLRYLNSSEGREFTPISAIAGVLENSKKHAEELERLERQVNNLTSQVQTANQRTSEIESELNTLQDAHDKLKGDQVIALRSTSTSELQDVKDQLSNMTQERDDALTERDDARNDLAARTQERDDARTERDNARNDLAARTQERDDARTERDNARNDLAARTQERDDARNDLVTRTQERDDALTERDNARALVNVGVPTNEADAQALADRLGATLADMTIDDYVGQRNRELVLGHQVHQRALLDLDAERLNALRAQQDLDVERARVKNQSEYHNVVLTQYQQQQQQMQTQQQQLVNNGAYATARRNNL